MNSRKPAGELSIRRRNTLARLILSVDDEPGILVTRQQILENAGYEVLSAADGAEALRFFASYDVDLVLLDFAMPDMDGGMVSQAMKRHNGRVPIIFVSASPVSEETLACAECRLDKGEGPSELLKKISQLLAAGQVGSGKY
jgi:two-component system OmpR family response regulator